MIDKLQARIATDAAPAARARILRTARVFGLALLGFAFAPLSAQADPGFRNVTLSSAKDASQSEAIFRPDTAKIYLRAELSDVPPDARMTCAWIAAQAVGAPQNLVIDLVDQTAGTILGVRVNVLNCEISKPTAGWPVGSYRVELQVNGKKTNEAPFEVKADTSVPPVAAAPAPAVAAGPARQNFTIVNRTGYDILEVYVSPAKAKDWEEDVLGDDELEDGDERLIRFNRAEKTCLWDLKVVYTEDSSEAIWYDTDLCKIRKITIRYNSKTDKTTATFD